MAAKTMKAIRIHQSPDPNIPYSPTNPAPSSALHCDGGIPVPTLTKPGEVLIRTHAVSVTRDELTWPETYDIAAGHLPIPGMDLAGEVVEVYQENDQDPKDGEPLKPGDELFGLVDAAIGSTWAEYTVTTRKNLALKPPNLNYAESVAVVLSALTAWQALFIHSSFTAPDFQNPILISNDRISAKGEKPRLLISGASGSVGIYLVQLASLANLHITAVTSSNDRNATFLRSLGADTTLEYSDFASSSSNHNNSYDVIIDTVGSSFLPSAYNLIKPAGKIISVDSASFDFARAGKEKLKERGKEDVEVKFFIVEPDGKQLRRIAEALERGMLRSFVARCFEWEEVVEAYEVVNEGRVGSRGKVVLLL